MLSDESSSDSETGRFKSSQSRKADDQNKSSDRRDSHRRDSGRSRAFNERLRPAERLRENDRFRPSEGDRMRRDLDRRREDRDRYERRSKDRQRPPRHSPVRRRHSRERSPARRRRSQDEDKSKRPQEDKSGRDTRDRKDATSRDHKRRSTSHISSEKKKEEPAFKDEPKPSAGKYDRSRKRDSSSSPDYKSKRSVVQKPTYVEPPKRIVESPIDVEQHADSDNEEVQLGSYYSLKPVVVVKDKEKSVEKDTSKETIISDESSEIDSSDDERLRAKLLNLEKELSKTRKKKHKKKHKKRSKSEKGRDKSASVEVTSTTDIQETRETDGGKEAEVEVTSTQKSKEKESSEEGELSSDGSQSVEIDESDLRHKLKRGVRAEGGVCGPALPPHLQQRFRGDSPGVEGPALPPHLKKDNSKSIGPTIPSDMRKVLAEAKPEDIEYASSEEDAGFGPLPPGAEGKWTEAHERLERRAMDMKMKAQDGHTLQSKDVKGREKWMLELPEGKAKIIGIEARSFRAKEGPDMSDRSSWTDTPEERARKAAGLPASEDAGASLQREARERYVAQRDHAQEREARKHKKKHRRDESLLEMHEKKLKKKKKKEERADGKEERRPFSRDVDLAVNRFDEAQKKSIIKKAQALDTRFSRGDAKYL